MATNYFAVVTELMAVAFIWITPPRTAYMLQDGEPITYQFVSLKHVSRYTVAATIAHEDQQLGTRVGAFPLEDFQKRIDAYLKGAPDPSGSTIPQQLVKSIFLWPDQNGFRKGLEAVLATEFTLTLSKQRMMELHLNYAQFGPDLYGICAASGYYFKTPPWAMTEMQAAQLMGVLPLPNLVKRAPNGGIDLGDTAHPVVWDLVNGAANVWVPLQLEGMGGWKSAMGTIGMYDLASDYQAERDAKPDDPNSCSRWPQSVVDRYNREKILL